MDCDPNEVEVSLSPALKNLLAEVGLDESNTVTMKHSMEKGLYLVEASCMLDRETRETVKLARSSRSEATEAADRRLVARLRRRFFPVQVMAGCDGWLGLWKTSRAAIGVSEPAQNGPIGYFHQLVFHKINLTFIQTLQFPPNFA